MTFTREQQSQCGCWGDLGRPGRSPDAFQFAVSALGLRVNEFVCNSIKN